MPVADMSSFLSTYILPAAGSMQDGWLSSSL